MAPPADALFRVKTQFVTVGAHALQERRPSSCRCLARLGLLGGGAGKIGCGFHAGAISLRPAACVRAAVSRSALPAPRAYLGENSMACKLPEGPGSRELVRRQSHFRTRPPARPARGMPVRVQVVADSRFLATTASRSRHCRRKQRDAPARPIQKPGWSPGGEARLRWRPTGHSASKLRLDLYCLS